MRVLVGHGLYELVDLGNEIARSCALLPLKDARRAEGILGYDEHGLPR